MEQVNSNAPKKRVHTPFEWALGIFYIVCVALIWTFASVLVQYIFQEMELDAPFFLTYVCASLFAVNLPIWWIGRVVYPRVARYLGLTSRMLYEPLAEPAVDRKYYTRVLRVSAIVAPIWFLASYAYNESLNETSITSSTLISSTSTIFTFLLSLLVLGERFFMVKLVGVLLCVAGCMTTIFNEDKSHGPVLKDHVGGDVLALLSAVLYGVYTVVIRRLIPDDDSISVALFFGFLGALHFIFLLPLVIANHYSGFEPLDRLTWQHIGLICVKGLFDNVLSDYLWAKAILLTSPTVATVGLSLTVPLAIVADLIFRHVGPTIVTWLASFLVVAGFLLINVSTRRHEAEDADPSKSLVIS